MAVSVPLLLLTLVAAAASVPLPAGRQPQRAQGLGTISLLRGEGLAEWNKLSAPAKAAATQQLERMTVTENDIESVHFDGKGKIFIADAKPIPKRGGDSHGDSDDNDDRRRAISDVTPDRFQSNGELKFGLAPRSTIQSGKRTAQSTIQAGRRKLRRPNERRERDGGWFDV